MSDWSVQRVEQLAPDPAAIKAARGVANPGQWRNLGRDDHVLWGECQGSGANPYQVRVDLRDAACKCSCPSRKLPCKHSLGLLLMMTGGVSIPLAPPPGFVEEWTADRAKRPEANSRREMAPGTPAAGQPASGKPPDVAAQSKRIEKREARVESGIAQLDAWLVDLIGQGLAAARAQPPAFWAQMAARLIDAQAPGLARRVRELSELAVSGPDWQSQLLAGLGRLQLLIDAYRRIEKLPAPLAADVRTLVGWTQDQEALLGREGIRDQWQVLGRRQGQQDQLRVQYTWLAGRDPARIALILDFAAGSQPLPANFVTGQVVDAEVVYFDGAPPLRALVRQRFNSEPACHTLRSPVDIANLQSRFASLLAVNPWLERWPAVVGPVTTVVERERTQFLDPSGRRIQARANFRHGWHLTALSGGGPVALFGLWDGHVFDPVTVEHEGRLFSIGQAGELPVLSKVA